MPARWRTRSGVDDNEYRLPFEFTGTIDKLNVKVGPNQMTVPEQAAAAKAIATGVNN